MKKISFIIICCLILTSTALPAESNGGYAGAFLRLGLGAEAISQGDAFTARADNGFSAYYNPAGLAFLQNKTFALSYSNLSLDRQHNFVGIAMPLKPTAGLSLGWVNAGVTEIDGRDFDGNHYQTLSFYENAFAFAFANRFSKYVSAGVGVKVFYSLFPQALENGKALKASGVGFDFGLLLKPHPKFQLGLQIRDINGKYGWDSSQFYSEGITKNDQFPRIYKAGIAILPSPDVALEYDLETSDKEDVEHHFGMEFSTAFKPQYLFALRAGYDQDVPTFGFGFNFPIAKKCFQLDLAYIFENISPEDTMIFSWSILF